MADSMAADGAQDSARDRVVEDHDLVFVGAGASTAYTLVSLLDELASAPPRTPLRIGVVERGPDPFSGLPYGDRAARTCLLITSLRDFLPEAERADFSAWLSRNKHWVFDEFIAAAGPVAGTWWDRHRDEIVRDDFDPLFLPRYAFGAYLKDRTQAAIARAETAGRARVLVVRDEVTAVRASGDRFVVDCAGQTLTARRVVLAVGSPPALPRLTEHSDRSRAVLVDDPFDDLPRALGRIAELLTRTPSDRAPHVVVLGGNASAMDVIYQVEDLARLHARDIALTVLSPRGELPALLVDDAQAPGFRTEELDALAASDSVRAADVYQAAVSDIRRGREQGLSGAHTLRPVSQAVSGLLPRLSAEETAEFAGRWGAQLGRHQRRAGSEYWEVVDQLAGEGRFSLVAGSFTGLVVDPDGTTHVEYLAARGATRLDRPADVVVNCAGPAGDLRVAAPGLLSQLITEGVCRVSRHGAGLAVGPDMTATDGMYVMGPLLAGNVVAGGPIWHMEHCGRISSYGTDLGRRLATELRAA